MKSLTNIAVFAALISLTSCARSCQKMERNTLDNHKHKIKITHYSGGEVVGQWEIFGIVNDAEGSDGYFFYDNNEKLTEISGDVRLEYLD